MSENKGRASFHVSKNMRKYFTKIGGSWGSQEEKSKDFYQLEKKDYEEMPTQKMKSPPLTDNAKSSLKIVFLTLFSKGL